MKKLTFADFPTGEEIIYVPNFIKNKFVTEIWVVREVSKDTNNLICDRMYTEEWTGIQEQHLENYMSIENIEIKYPEYFV